MLDEHVEFLERAFVEQDLEPLARGQPALGVLRVDPLLSAAEPRLGAALSKNVEGRGHTLSLFPGRVGAVGALCTAATMNANVVL